MPSARRTLLAATLLTLALVAVPAMPLAHSAAGTGGGTKADLSGQNALTELALFAMAHPDRHGELATMVRARDYLDQRLEDLGYEVVRHRYGGSQMGTNILGILPGTTRPHDWVVISAHYDTVQVPSIGSTVHGAWDDGSGVAAALEIARVAAQRSWNNTVVIAFFDDEELGLVGSSRFVPAFEGRTWVDPLSGVSDRIRLTANLNMDPPGLNWPCMVDGVYLPVTLFQGGFGGAGQQLLRTWGIEAKDLEGVPSEAYEFYYGTTSVGILTGSSDNVVFYQRGVPELYVGSSTHLKIGKTTSVNPFFFPLHTPLDTLPTMLAYCPDNLLIEGFEVEMRIVYHVLERIDSHGARFPKP